MKNTTWFMVSVIWHYDLDCPAISDLRLIGEADEEHFLNLNQLSKLRTEMLERFDSLVKQAEISPTKQLRLGTVAKLVNDLKK